VLDAQAAAGAGKYLDVSDFDYAVAIVSIPSTSTLTVKAAGAITETAPDMASAQSATNLYGYLALYDMDAATNVAGSTGVAVSAATKYGIYKITLQGLKWLNFIVTSYTNGSVTVKLRLYNG
jgi:hypothetical protein